VLDRWKVQELEFPLITKLAKALIVLPYSSAEVESLFSKFKVVKTPYRNRLSTLNLEASLLSEQFFDSNDFSILPEMYDKYTTMWASKKKKVIHPQRRNVETQCDNMEESNSKFIEAVKTINEVLPEIASPSSLFDFDNGINVEFDYVDGGLKRAISQNNTSVQGQKRVKTALKLFSLLNGLNQVQKEEVNPLAFKKDSESESVPKESQDFHEGSLILFEK